MDVDVNAASIFEVYMWKNGAAVVAVATAAKHHIVE